ncbi:hypothetical protein ABPG74_016602 [Tetrahymena malaccensis]
MDQDYLFIHTFENNNELILTISLNPIQLKIKTTLFGIYNPSDDLILSPGILSKIQYRWFFLRITIDLQQSSTNYYAHYLFFNQDSEISGININTTPYKEFSRISSKRNFDSSSFQMLIGQQAVYPYSAACSIVRQVILIVGQSTHSYGQIIAQQEQSILAEQVFYFNFGFASSWPSYQFNQAINNFGYSNYNKQSNFQDFTLNLQCSENWEVGQLEFDSGKGIMISIDFQVIGGQINSLSTIFLLEKQFNSNKQIFYEILSDSFSSTQLQLRESYLGVINNNSILISLNTWHRLTIILNINFDKLQKQIYIDDQQVFVTTPQISSNVGLVFFTIQNKQQNAAGTCDRVLFIKTVRVFQGTFVVPCDNCLAQAEIENQKNCLLCQTTALTINSVFSNYCSNSCSPLYHISVQNKVCDFYDNTRCGLSQPSYMMKYKSDGSCICPFGTFQNQGVCTECPEYCVLCDQPTYCIQYVVNPNLRNGSTGKCQLKNDFDDGISCISNFMKIPNRTNLKINLPNKIINCLNLNSIIQNQYLIKNDAFKIGTASNSFFISVSFNINSPTNNIGETYTILFMQDQNRHILTLTGVLQANSIKLQLYLKNEIIIQGLIGINSDIWIGLYTDLSNFNLIIKQQNAPISYYSAKTQGLGQLVDPELYVGGVISYYKTTTYPLCGSLLQNIFILYGDYSMNLFPQSLHIISFPQMINILDFNFSEYSSILFQTQLTIQNMLDSTKSIIFNTLNLGFDLYKGLFFDDNSQSQISIALAQQFAIKFMIYPITNSIFSNWYTFLQILDNSHTQVIALKLLYVNSLSSRAKLQICLNFLCQTMKYVTIKMNDINQIFIQFNAETKNSRFCIVVNYKYEELNFSQELTLQFSNLNSIIQIGSASSGPTYNVFYFNNLNVYLGGFFYLDYDLSDPCFLYITQVNMICAIPKQGYTLKDGNAIQQNQCNYGRKPFQTVLFNNPFVMRCQDSRNVIPYCLEINYSNTKQCTLCLNDSMSAINNCVCLDGQYLNLQVNRCLQCSPKCLTCSGTADNCTVCKDQSLQIPSCLCLYSNQFMKSDQTCGFCDSQCSSCMESSSNCTACNQDRQYLPFCRCKQAYFENTQTESISNACRPLICSYQCKTCSFSSQNCDTCKGNRINPPSCICQEGFYEDPSTNQGDCLQCPSGQFFDVQKNQCMNCYSNCSKCNGPLINNCLSCQKGLELQNDKQCMCPYGSQAAQEFDPDYPCYYFMKLDFSITHKNQKFQINIKFEYPIDNLKQIIQKYGINILFQLEIIQIPSQSYYDTNQYQVQSNSLLVIDVDILESFQATEAVFVLKQNSVFRNYNEKKIVDSFYLQNPFRFNIGPYLMVLGNRDKQIINAINQVTPQSTQIIQFLGSFQFLFYLLNSIQPTSSFLLINVNIPANLYAFLSLFGTFVFKEMPQYSDREISQNTKFYGISVDDKLKSSGNIIFDRLGFRNSFLFNCQIIFFKYLFIIVILLVIQIFHKKTEFLKKEGIFIKESNKLKKLETFLIVRLSKENEINLFMIILSFCMQISEIDQDSWLCRWGFYTGIFTFGVFLTYTIYFFIYYNNSRYFQNSSNIFEHFYERLNLNGSEKNQIIRNYHFIYHIKKILLMIIIYSMVNYPYFVCGSGIFFNLITAILTIKLKPYKYLLQSIIKAIGDVILTIAWIFMIFFNNFKITNVNSTLLNKQEVDSFLAKGFYAIIFLLIFNLLFLINFLFENIFVVIYEYIQKQIRIRQNNTN